MLAKCYYAEAIIKYIDNLIFHFDIKNNSDLSLEQRRHLCSLLIDADDFDSDFFADPKVKFLFVDFIKTGDHFSFANGIMSLLITHYRSIIIELINERISLASNPSSAFSLHGDFKQ